ncbi:MAG: PAS domain S-box protein, partial [Ignavibacteriales bacterium]
MANKVTSSEKRFREMAELLPQTLFEVDNTGRLTYANPIAFELFGYSRKDFEAGINIIQLIHPDDHTRAIENINKIYKGALLGGSEYIAVKKDGTQFPTVVYTTRQEENGNLIGLRGILLDISNIKQAEESIKASEEKFKSIVQGLTDMIFIVNAEGMISFITPSVTRITGFTEDEMIGNSPLEFIHPDDVELAISELRQSEKSTYESTPTLYRLKNKNGFYIFIETIGIDMMNNKYVNGVVVFCRNVTERIEYERQLSESEAKLKESQRVAKIGHYDFDIASGIWTSSDGLDELFGIDKSYQHNLSGWDDLLHPDDREKMNDYLSNYVVKEKNRFEKEYRIIRYSDKQVIWVYGLGNLEYNERQIPVKMFGTIQNITDRKIAQNVLFNSEQRFKYIWENTLDAMRITDERGKIILVNDAFCKMVNKNREELEGSSFTVVFKEEERENAKINYLKNFRNKSLAGRNEYHIKFWNNKIIFADISIVFLKIPEQPTLLLTVLHDITDRKIAEDYLRESEEKFRQTFDYSAAGVMILNLDSKFQKVNTAFVKMIGYSENELRKMSFKDITFPDDLAESDLICHSLLENKISNTSFEKRYVTKDNKIIWGYVSISLVKDLSNKPLYFVVQVFDITDQKQADEAVRKLSMAVEQSPAIIMITNTAGHIEYVNKKFTNITGYTFDEVIGLNPKILKSGHTSGKEYSELWKTISSGNEWRGEFLNKKKNGEFYWEYAFISPIVNEVGIIKNYLAVKEDITERKKLIADLIETKQKAEEMNKIKSYFFANMSHELRTPFVGIMGFSELLSESLQNPEEKEMAQQILKSSQRLT